MANPVDQNSKRIPIPIFWVYVFAGMSFLVLILISSAVQSMPTIHHPGKIVFLAALIVIPSVFFILHKVCIALEYRGHIYYRVPKTAGVAAGSLLDLEILFTGRKNQVENIRMAREALNEGTQQDSQGDKPHENQTHRAE